MHFIDIIKFGVQKLKNYSANTQFKNKHPEIKLPPDYMMFEAFQLNYDKYYNGGKTTANFIKTEIEIFTSLSNVNILDWGCGPARVLRHMPSIINNNCNFYGTDYNHNAIDWCANNIKGIDFRYNEIKPPLKFEANFFSAIYMYFYFHTFIRRKPLFMV